MMDKEASRYENKGVIDDGFGNEWMLCDREPCDLEIVRPGKVQCWCDGRRKWENLETIEEIERLTVERDLAIAHDTQPYPTAWAYEQAYKALNRYRVALEQIATITKGVLNA